MPSQVLSSVENNFTKGLVTEFTGLNFPENAATDTDNCAYSIVGDVTRRLGIDREVNGLLAGVSRTNLGLSDYKWNNAGGSGSVQIVVRQIGASVFFYRSSSATTDLPLSQQVLGTVVDLTVFLAGGGTFDSTLECQYADGNGYLFIYHPSCNPISITYNAGSITPAVVTVKVRDFGGLIDGLPTETRPATLSVAHQYNIVNQGWVKGYPWDVTSSTAQTVATGAQVYNIGAGVLGIVAGQTVRVLYETGGTIVAPFDTPMMSGTVTGYAGALLTLNITQTTAAYNGKTGTGWRIQPTSVAYIDAWLAAVGNYPSNADVWWYFKNAAGAFDPATTNGNVTISTGNAPRGHFLLNLFDQQRSSVSGISGINPVTTTVRPRTGAWFQGRVWYSGIDASSTVQTDVSAYSWSESVYFSQIITDPSQFGNCFQQNDPTSENLFDILPTDGGVITIQGCGSIYKLFSIQNGMLVFAANGIWFITGSRGIGFSANDYTITKISSVRSISGTSIVDVNGLPYFWNAEGIYAVQPTQGGGLEVNPLTVGTILSFYEEIPINCKQYARGAYDPINYTLQWVYRDTDFTTVNDRYIFNKILNYNTYNKAFFPYTMDVSIASVNGIVYVSYPGSATAPTAGFKYPASYVAAASIVYADEHDTTYTDWATFTPGFDFDSFFVTGFKLHGQGQRRFQIPYIYVYSNNDAPTSYKIQGLWDYATSGNSGKWSIAQLVNNFNPNFGLIFRRHRIRGRGLILQLKVSSVSGQPFDIIGWSTFETQNMSV